MPEPQQPRNHKPPALVSTGIPGLDDVLRGGLTPARIYLVEGAPGAGKTTLALQFLLEGLRRGESTLYVTLSESRDELIAVAASHGWNVDGLNIFETAPPEESLSPEQQLTMFHPSELELGETTRRVLEQIEHLKPTRVVFDSLSEMRLMSQNPLRYRRQILALKQFFTGRKSTVLLLDDLTSSDEDLQLQSIVHGVIRLDRIETQYGSERRQLRILKMRGIAYRGGLHDFVIRRGGLDVFPRLIASEHHVAFSDVQNSSGLPMLDALLGGGLPPGSSTLFLGPAGVGKSTVAMQFCIAAASRGERSAIFTFDETVGMFLNRARKLNLPVDPHVKSGLITVRQVDPAELSPGEFVSLVRQAITGSDDNPHRAKVVMIDSLNGYLHSMSEERQLVAQLHELFIFMNQNGVSTMVTVAQSGMAGPGMHSPVDTTYLADNVILFRYFESFGRVRRAISVVKKRSGNHERTIRELDMTKEGIQIGEPLHEFQGILTGVPTFHGSREQMLKSPESRP